MTYSSSNPQVATVDATTGLVTGVAAGPVTITAMKDGCTAGTIALTVTSDGGDSGETTKTGTISNENDSSVLYPYEYNSSTGIITIKVDGKYNDGGNYRLSIKSVNELNELIPIKYELSIDGGTTNVYFYSAQIVSWKTLAFSEGTASIDVSSNSTKIKDFNSNYIGFYVNGEKGNMYTLKIYTKNDGLNSTPQSLSAPRRAVAAAAVIESEQLLSAANETAGVQTQALENTIDASEVSDSDWASGLLLEIDATDHWQGSVTNLSVTDSNGNTYYYWAVEEPVTGYTPSYLFQDADGSQSNAIKADAQVDGTDIIILNTKQDTSYTLPSTGGTGVTRYYLIGLLLMGGSGLVVCYQFRRKRHGNCAK